MDFPRFFTVFLSQLSSESLLVPSSFYDELPSLLPQTAILQNSGGSWNVRMIKRREEVYFGQGWAKFVEDNTLSDGEFMTFVYDEDRVFEVSIYGRDGCKETRAVTEVVEDDDKEDSICSLSSRNSQTSSDSDLFDTSSESELVDTTPRSKNKGLKETRAVTEVEDDDKEDSVCSLSSRNSETSSESDLSDTSSQSKLVDTIPRSKNKGKEEVVESSDDYSDSDSDNAYIEAFGSMDFEESSDSDSSYAPVCKDTITCVQSKVTNPNNKGKSKVIENVDAIVASSHSVVPKQKRDKIIPKIKNPAAYLDNPDNIHFETGIKKRKYELLVNAQLVKDYCLKFQDYVYYIDTKGKLIAKTTKWKDRRVCIKQWTKICQRNNLKKTDRVLCELLRKGDLVFAVKVHIIREKDL